MLKFIENILRFGKDCISLFKLFSGTINVRKFKDLRLITVYVSIKL